MSYYKFNFHNYKFNFTESVVSMKPSPTLSSSAVLNTTITNTDYQSMISRVCTCTYNSLVNRSITDHYYDTGSSPWTHNICCSHTITSNDCNTEEKR